jgi:RNA polymerase sigma-70 factor, ECF subfamily
MRPASRPGSAGGQRLHSGAPNPGDSQQPEPQRCLKGTVITMGEALTERPPTSATDLATFDRRFAELQPRLLRICAGLVGADQAQDVVHDTYLRSRSRYAQLRDAAHFDAWVARTATNLCFNRHRSGRRLQDRLPRLVAGRPASAPRDVGLRELIEALPPRERTVVVLHYGHGYKTDEIAARVGTSPSNARSILFRARRRLAVQLREAATE